MSSELKVSGITRYVNHFMDQLLCPMGTKRKVTPDALTDGLPSIFFLYQIKCGTVKNTRETKARSLNKDQWFLNNGCICLELKYEVKNLGLLWKFVSRFKENYAKDVFGGRVFVISSKKG
jgi:hypothetical protein